MKKIINFKFKIMFLAVIVLFVLSCDKNNNQSKLPFKTFIKTKDNDKETTFGVISVDRLRFRSDNDIHSKTMMYLDKGEIVSIVKKDQERVKVGEVEDYWYQIEYKGTKGWIFGHFVDVYQSLDDAKENAKKYKFVNSSDLNLDEKSINKNLFFLKNGQLYQLINFKNKEIKKINTYQDYGISDYFFNKDGSAVFYIAKRSQNENGILYLHNLKNNANQMVENNVFAADPSEKNNLLVLISKNKNKYWQISSRNMDLKTYSKNIAKINFTKELQIMKVDAFSQTMAREKSALVYLDYNESGNIIYFKPPEQNEMYVISANNGEYIKTEKEQDANFYIDASQYITVASSEDEKNNVIYNIVLNDKFSGRQKDLVSSAFYPINFSLSPKKNFVSMTMVDLNKIVDGGYYFSSIYILSLQTNAFYSISADGRSYLSKWSSKQIN